VEAVRSADWIVLGPGSWYTSVLPHLLVPELRAALRETSAPIVLTLNLAAGTGETAGMRAEHYLDVIHDYAPELRFAVVVADPAAVEDAVVLADHCELSGAQLVLRQVSRGDGTARHDPLRLAAAYRDAMDRVLGDVG